MAMNKNTPQDPAQQQMQKSMNTFMPIMLTFTFVIIPIPAGVLLYLISSNVFQVVHPGALDKNMTVHFGFSFGNACMRRQMTLGSRFDWEMA